MNMTVGQALNLPDGSVIRLSVQQDLAPTYEVFCNCVERKVLDIALDMERNKKNLLSLGEDPRTTIIGIALKAAGFDAEHDTNRNGHVDLLVKNGRYEWMAEAKNDNGPAYIMEGFRQLVDRYADGNPNSSSGALLIYTDKANKSTLLDNWIKHVSDYYEYPISNAEKCMETLTSRTTHVSEATGLNYRVRHIPISFYYKPTDKSARNSKEHKG